MYQVENNITGKNIERAKHNTELERRRETECKYILDGVAPDFIEIYKPSAYPVEQIYLSSPEEEFSLRVRRARKPGGTEYTATIKDRGETTPEGTALARTEITTGISQAAYERYAVTDAPRVAKHRLELSDAVTIDFFDTGDIPVVAEVEHEDPEIRHTLAKQLAQFTEATLKNYSDNPRVLNESIAYSTQEYTPRTPESLHAFTETIVRDMIAHYVTGKEYVVVGISGMSGSGKSTVTNLIRKRITELYGDAFTPITLSTDDYHFGKQHLESLYGAPYADWDDPKTYDTVALAQDIELLTQNVPITRRHFSFITQEPALLEPLPPSPLILIEGLYAGSNDLRSVRSLHYTVPTGIATSIGRDVRRLVLDNRGGDAFPTPESRLRYQIEVALPLYTQHEAQIEQSNSHTGCARPLAARAFMLERLR